MESTAAIEGECIAEEEERGKKLEQWRRCDLEKKEGQKWNLGLAKREERRLKKKAVVVEEEEADEM